MLSVVRPGGRASDRFEETLAYALEKRRFSVTTCLPAPIENRRLLFAVPLNESGINSAYYQLLAFLRTHPGSLKGCVGGVLVDGPGNLYTKSLGRELALAASLAGCTFPGRPLVEATGDLRNLDVYKRQSLYSLVLPLSYLTDTWLASTAVTTPSPSASTTISESIQTLCSIPVPTMGAWGRSRGTA